MKAPPAEQARGETGIPQSYIERFGKPRAGSLAFIRTAQQVTG
jgi:hypothetical protein